MQVVLVLDLGGGRCIPIFLRFFVFNLLVLVDISWRRNSLSILELLHHSGLLLKSCLVLDKLLLLVQLLLLVHAQLHGFHFMLQLSELLILLVRKVRSSAKLLGSSDLLFKSHLLQLLLLLHLMMVFDSGDKVVFEAVNLDLLEHNGLLVVIQLGKQILDLLLVDALRLVFEQGSLVQLAARLGSQSHRVLFIVIAGLFSAVVNLVRLALSGTLLHTHVSHGLAHPLNVDIKSLLNQRLLLDLHVD